MVEWFPALILGVPQVVGGGLPLAAFEGAVWGYWWGCPECLCHITSTLDSGWCHCFWVSHHQLLLTVDLGLFLGCFVLPQKSPCRDMQLVLGLLCAHSKLSVGSGEAEGEWSWCWPHHGTSTTQEKPQVMCEQAVPSAGRASAAPFKAKE